MTSVEDMEVGNGAAMSMVPDKGPRRAIELVPTSRVLAVAMVVKNRRGRACFDA